MITSNEEAKAASKVIITKSAEKQRAFYCERKNEIYVLEVTPHEYKK